MSGFCTEGNTGQEELVSLVIKNFRKVHNKCYFSTKRARLIDKYKYKY